MSKLTIAGIGPGDAGYIIPAVAETIKEAHCVIAAGRILPTLESLADTLPGNPPVFQEMGKVEDTLEQIGRLLSEEKDVVLAVSGDPLMYSLYRTICNHPCSKDWEMKILPGIGSLQMLGAAFGETMEDACIVSVHGRKQTPGSIALRVAENPAVFFLCSKEQGPDWLSKIMLEYGQTDVTVFAASDLSYPEERLVSGSPEEMAQKEFPSLCVAMIKNPSPKRIQRPCFLSDEDFERDRTPMTKEEIRVLILHKMKLHPDDIVWDVGAGTGSVSIEMALSAPCGHVYAIERRQEAVEVLKQNISRFHTDNVHTVFGTAPECCADLPAPTHAFLGGTSGNMQEIIGLLTDRNPHVRIAATAVTLESIAELTACMKQFSVSEAVCVNVSRDRCLGSYRLMTAQNPIYIFTMQN